jgi:uncharacterized membrane-anchored protein
MNKLVTLATVVVVQSALVGAAVGPQLMARFTGETYEFRVAPLDPIDPFRGAYVTLDYPDLPRHGQAYTSEGGSLYVTLIEENGVMVADDHLTERPSGDQPYLACRDRGWHFECGIESLFLPQDEAAAMDELLRDGAIAEVRIDKWGHAALIDVRAP